MALEVHSEAEVSEADLRHAISDKIHFLYGVKGAAETDFRMIEYDEQRMRGIIRCSHDRLTETRAAIAHIMAINGAPAAIHVVTASGTIKTLRRRLESITEKVGRHG